MVCVTLAVLQVALKVDRRLFAIMLYMDWEYQRLLSRGCTLCFSIYILSSELRSDGRLTILAVMLTVFWHLLLLSRNVKCIADSRREALQPEKRPDSVVLHRVLTLKLF